MPRVWRVAAGERIYAIGDIHGRSDLFENLLNRIEDDNRHRPQARVRIVVLGDVIDRGPSSAALVRRLMRYTRASGRFVVLKGNHEAIMAEALRGRLDALEGWLKVGGEQTLLSWGLQLLPAGSADLPALLMRAQAAVSSDVVAWIDERPLSWTSGDVLFVHAGVRPGVALADQNPRDLIWIGREFLDHQEPHPWLVVHGHTAVDDGPVIRSNRIGLDTGAYRSGRLTAMGFEGPERWTLSAAL